MQAIKLDQASSGQTFNLNNEFADVFTTALRCRQACGQCKTLLPDEMASITAEIASRLGDRSEQLNSLSRHCCYSRNIIGEDQGWTGLICRWEAGASSSVHGHPAFTFYHVIEGSFTMELYDRTESDKVAMREARKMTSGDSYWEYGEEGRYDNMIHRVIAEQPGFTLQLFSEDPGLGQVFTSDPPLNSV